MRYVLLEEPAQCSAQYAEEHVIRSLDSYFAQHSGSDILDNLQGETLLIADVADSSATLLFEILIITCRAIYIIYAMSYIKLKKEK
ncbi:MAG: hypothetical protein MJY71_02560 [Bacteroidaceae bacterium]|nr:hypothetical protein [Bacteroidaceae bacterium]